MVNLVKIEYLENYKWDKLCKATEWSSGFDLRACIDKDELLVPMSIKLVPAGFKLQMTSTIEAQIRSRSGLSIKGIIVINSPGTVDFDFVDEIHVILANFGKKSFVIKHGMRIAQMVFAPVLDINLMEVDTIDTSKDRGGGFGSTGV